MTKANMTMTVTDRADRVLGTKFCSTGNHRVPIDLGRTKIFGSTRRFECFDCDRRRKERMTGAG